MPSGDTEKSWKFVKVENTVICFLIKTRKCTARDRFIIFPTHVLFQLAVREPNFFNQRVEIQYVWSSQSCFSWTHQISNWNKTGADSVIRNPLRYVCAHWVEKVHDRWYGVGRAQLRASWKERESWNSWRVEKCSSSVDKDLIDAKSPELKCQLSVQIFQLEIASSFAGNPPSGVLFNSTISSPHIFQERGK